MSKKLFCLFIILTTLFPLSPMGAAQQNVHPPLSVWQIYYLQLPMPTFEPTHLATDAIPGYYQAALQQHWTETEGVLKALQARGLVQSYSLAPRANAFYVTARPEGAKALALLGAVERVGLSSTLEWARAEQRFSNQLTTAIQNAQAPRKTAPSQQAQPPAPTTPNPVSKPTGAPPQAGILDLGGPDAFGYRYIDSNEVDGPSYDWIDISDSGTEITAGSSLDDGYLGPIPIGFMFDFYGNSHTQLYVGSNGYLSFGSGYGQAPWGMLPNSDPPNNDIMPLGGDKYILGSTTHVYYQTSSNPDRFVVQFVDLDECCITGMRSTFQVILYPDGHILTQYQSVQGMRTYAAGIENGDGTVGLNYAIANLSDSLAVLYIPRALQLIPTTQGGIGEAGETISYNQTIYNFSDTSDSYDLNVQDNTWVTTLWDSSGVNPISSVGPLAPGESKDFMVRVQIPSSADGGDYDTANVQATSTASPTLQASAQVNTAVALINVREYNPFVSGYVAPNSPVELLLIDDQDQIKASQTTNSDANGYFSNNFDIYNMPGDTVHINIGDTTASVYLPELMAIVERDADAVSGLAPPNITSTNPDNPPVLEIEASGVNLDSDNWETVSEFTTTDADGNYAETFSSVDLRAASYGWLRYTNAQGHQVFIYYHAPEARVQLSSDNVSGYMEPQANVTVTLQSDSGALKGQFTTQAGGDGWFSGSLRDVYNNAVITLPGDQVLVQTAQHINVPVVAVDALADPIANTVGGQAPANITSEQESILPNLCVQLYSSQYVTTDENGNYLADNVGEFNAGNNGETRYYNLNGDQVYVDFVSPVLRLRGTSNDYQATNYVSGYAATFNTLVTLTLKRDDDALATIYDVSGPDGYYWGYFVDNYGHPISIQADDTVEINASGGSIEVDAPTLTASADPDADTVSGIAPADIVSTTWVTPHTLQVRTDSPAWSTIPATTTHSGEYTADFGPHGGINADSSGWMRYIDHAGHYIYQDFAAPDPTGPTFYIRGWANYVSDNYFGLYMPNHCGLVQATLKDTAGQVKASAELHPCESDTTYFYDEYASPVPIQADDSIQVNIDGQIFSYDVWEMTAQANLEENTISGVAPGGIWRTDGTPPSLWVDVSWWDDQYVTTTLPMSGSLVAPGVYHYATPYNIQGGESVSLRFQDETPSSSNPHTTWFHSAIPYADDTPKIAIRGDYGSGQYYTDYYVSGHALNFCGYGSVTLQDSQDTVKAQHTNVWACPDFGVYLYDIHGFSANVQAGDNVQVVFGEQSAMVSVPSFAVTSDHVNDTLTGLTDAEVVTDAFGANQTLALWPNSFSDGSWGKYALPDAGGAFSATNPFYDDANSDWSSTNLDWDANTRGHLRYIDVDGNRIYAQIAALYDEPQIWVHKDNNYVWGYLPQTAAAVTITLSSSDTVQAMAFTQTQINGYFSANLYDIHGFPVTIVQGDEVQVESAAALPIVVPVVTLSGQTNADTDVVSGAGPANVLLNIVAGGSAQSVSTDDQGDYSADLRGFYDVLPGSAIDVQHQNDQGHTVYIRFYAGPKLYAQLDTYYAWGYAPSANAPVTVTLKSGDDIKGSDTTNTNAYSLFWAYLYNSGGQRAIIEAGDTLEVNFGGGELVSMTISGLTAQVDARNDTIEGTGPANTNLSVEINAFNQSVTTDDDGNWSVDSSGIENIVPGEQVVIRHTNHASHETWLYATDHVVYARGSGSDGDDYIADHYISGYATQNSTVNISLRRDDSTIASQHITPWWSGSGYYYSTYLCDELNGAVDIQAGDQIIINTPSAETIDVPALEATMDVETSTVSGIGPANADLGVYTSGYNQTVHTDAGGVFSATFDNIVPGSNANIRYQNVEGHWTHIRAQMSTAAVPVIKARWNTNTNNACSNCVSGQAGAVNTVAMLTLERDGSPIATASDVVYNAGVFSTAFTDALGQAVNIQNGDTIELETDSATTTMMVADLTAQANAESGVLYGAGPANADLYYWYGYPWSGWSGTSVIDAGGHYYIELGLDNQMYGYVRYIDDAGHYTYIGWAVPFIGVRKDSNYVYGYTVYDTPVTVYLLNSSGSERGSASTTSAQSSGYFSVNLTDAAGDPLIIQADNQVVVETTQAITVPVPALSATADPINDQITGTGDPNTELNVSAGSCWRDVTTDADGAFTADTSDECDLVGGDWVNVQEWNDEGNLVYINFAIPLVRVNTANDIVDGYATPNALVNLSLTPGGVTTPTATVSAASNAGGFFSAFFSDANDQVIDIQAGDTVQVSASPTVELPVENLSASIDIQTDVVSGNGPANAILLVKVFVWRYGYWTSSNQTAYTDSSGNFDASFDLDLTDISYAYVRYSNAQGHQTSYTTTPPYSPLSEKVEQTVQSAGAPVKVSVFGTANGGDLSTPVFYQGGGGTLVFASQGGYLVITRPDGSVDDNNVMQTSIENAPAGAWKVQVRVSGGEGKQYAIAIGQAAYHLYLPTVTRNLAP